MAGALLQSAEWHSQSDDCLMAENSKKWQFYSVIKCHSLPLNAIQVSVSERLPLTSSSSLRLGIVQTSLPSTLAP